MTIKNKITEIHNHLVKIFTEIMSYPQLSTYDYNTFIIATLDSDQYLQQLEKEHFAPVTQFIDQYIQMDLDWLNNVRNDICSMSKAAFDKRLNSIDTARDVLTSNEIISNLKQMLKESNNFKEAHIEFKVEKNPTNEFKEQEIDNELLDNIAARVDDAFTEKWPLLMNKHIVNQTLKCKEFEKIFITEAETLEELFDIEEVSKPNYVHVDLENRAELKLFANMTNLDIKQLIIDDVNGLFYDTTNDVILIRYINGKSEFPSLTEYMNSQEPFSASFYQTDGQL